MAQAQWYTNVSIKGDVRFRFEDIKEQDIDNRYRERIRARVGVYANLPSDFKAGFRVATDDQNPSTGRWDPVSRNISFTDNFSAGGVMVDQAYVQWAPSYWGLKGLQLTGGKMATPFYRVGDYLFDDDLTPAGLAANYDISNDMFACGLNADSFWLKKYAAADDDKMYVGQIYGKVTPSKSMYAMVGGTAYYYDGIKDTLAKDLNWQGAEKAYGNSTAKKVSGSTTNVVYSQDYTVLEPWIEVGFKLGLPIKLFGSFAYNTEADSDNTGYMLGVTLGKAKDPNTWEVSYNWRHLEKDATLGALTDSDSWGGGTNGEGSKISAKYAITKNFQLGAAYFYDQKGLDNGKDYHRVQVDLVAAF
jgi:hypothetical protein